VSVVSGAGFADWISLANVASKNAATHLNFALDLQRRANEARRNKPVDYTKWFAPAQPAPAAPAEPSEAPRPPMTEEERQARIEEIRAELRSRGVTPP
jgi:hypothetical protein